MSDFVLNNATLLRGYLSHLQSLARRVGHLYFEKLSHPDQREPVEPSETLKLIQQTWDELGRGLVIVIGPDAALKPFNELAGPGSFHLENSGFTHDPFRITMKALKLDADKARRKHPELTLMLNWDLVAKAPPDPDNLFNESI